MGSGLPSAVSTIITSARAMKAQYIVAERAKWRDKIRDSLQGTVVEPSRKNRTALWLTLKLNTNPFHAEDRKIVELARNGASMGFTDEVLEELTDRIALLLKHDWDRAKVEVGSNDMVRRIGYEEYRSIVEHPHTSESRKSWSGQRPIGN